MAGRSDNSSSCSVEDSFGAPSCSFNAARNRDSEVRIDQVKSHAGRQTDHAAISPASFWKKRCGSLLAELHQCNEYIDQVSGKTKKVLEEMESENNELKRKLKDARKQTLELEKEVNRQSIDMIHEAIHKYNTNLLTQADDLPVKDLEINIDHVPEEEWARYFATFRKRLEECLNDCRGKLAQLEKMIPEIEAEGRRLDEELKRVSSQLAEEESSFELMRTNRLKMEETIILTEKRLEKRISELEALQGQAALKEAERVEVTKKIEKVEKDLHYVRTEGKAFLERKKLYHELQLHREQKEKEMISGIQEELEQYREAKKPE